MLSVFLLKSRRNLGGFSHHLLDIGDDKAADFRNIFSGHQGDEEKAALLRP
jgi:hypothetical protein